MVLLGYPVKLDDGEESDGEDSISLFDLPTMPAAADDQRSVDGRDLQLDPFEFYAATRSSEMCAAEDVIRRGKLLPFGVPPPLRPTEAQAHIADLPKFDHRRSSSLGEPQPRRCWGGNIAGVEYRKLKKVTGPDSGSDLDLKPRPRWYVLVFGSVRVPAAMEMREIRVRQRRRSAPPPVGRRPAAVDAAGRGPWRVLRSLSCHGTEAVVVA